MAALAKKKSGYVAAWRGRARPRVAQDFDAPQDSAVHRQHARLEAAFAEVHVEPYPAPIRLAILFGAPAAMWAGLMVVLGQVLPG